MSERFIILIPKNYKMKIGDHVIVETARGVEFGRVVLGPKEVSEDEVVHPLKVSPSRCHTVR